MDLDTFFTTLYVLVEDWYKGEMSARFRRHAGPALQMSDSEVLTVAIAAQWRVDTRAARQPPTQNTLRPAAS